jgi:hypothetical protein
MRTVLFAAIILTISGVVVSQVRPKTLQEIQQQRRTESEQKRKEALDRKAREQQAEAENRIKEKQVMSRIEEIVRDNRALSEKVFRLEYLCQQSNVDMAMVYNDAIWPLWKFDEIKAGKTAFIHKPDSLRIDQIVDAKNMICNLFLNHEQYSPQKGSMSSETKKYSVWIKGVDTTNLVDDKERTIDITAPMKVTGTTQYPTVLGGTKTIFVLEPSEMPKITANKK